MLINLKEKLKTSSAKFLMMWELASETANTAPIKLNTIERFFFKLKIIRLLYKTMTAIRKEQKLKMRIDAYRSYLAASNIFFGDTETEQPEEEPTLPILEFDPAFISPPANYEN